MMTLSLATRNLLRNRRRSAATLLALAIGAAAVLLFGGYSADIRNGMITSYVQSGGHLQIQHKDFFLYGNSNPTAYGLRDYEKLIEAIRNDAVMKPLIMVVTPTLQFGGIAGNYAAAVSRTVIGMGYVADDVDKMRDWNEFTLPPSRSPFALVGASEDAAIVGIGLARVLLLCEPLKLKHCPVPASIDAAPATAAPAIHSTLPSDIASLVTEGTNATPQAGPGKARVELLASQSRGSPNVASLSIVAAEDQGFKDLDEITIILQLRQAQRLVYSRDRPRATSIIVQLAHSADMSLARARLEAIVRQQSPGSPLAVLDFETLNPFYTQTMQFFDTIFGFIFGLIGAIVLFTVANTMSAAVIERTVEIGTVQAIGLRQAGVRRLFLTEGLLLGCAGAVLGFLAALLVAFIVNVSGITWLPPGSSSRLPLTIRVWGEHGMIVGTMVGLIVIAACSAWLPAWRAARLNIVEALRHA